MAQQPHCYVQYFIPYDGDTEEHPNVYLVKKPQKDLRLSDIQQAFPLPGQYFFRAKSTFGKTHVWFDLNDPSDQVPAFNGKTTLKVSRVSISVGSAAPAPAPVSARAAATPAPSAYSAPRAAAPAAAPAPQPSLLGKASAASEEHSDLLGVFSAPSASASGRGAGAGAAPAPIASSPVADPFAAPPASSGQRSGGAGVRVGGFGGLDPFATTGFGSVPQPNSAGAGVGAGMGGGGYGGIAAGGQRAQAPAPGGKKAGGSILDGDIFSM